jgi:hypothetical protein
MVSVFALIRKTFVQASRQPLTMAALGLGQPFGCRFQLSGMRNLLASREGEEMAKAGINPDLPIGEVRNGLWLGVDEQAQIPARGTVDDATALDLPLGQILSMEAQRAVLSDFAPNWLFGVGCETVVPSRGE